MKLIPHQAIDYDFEASNIYSWCLNFFRIKKVKFYTDLTHSWNIPALSEAIVSLGRNKDLP